MSDADKQTHYGKQITEYINLPTRVNVGDDMTDGVLYDIDGNLQKIAQFKGKFILLDFWNRYCGACIESIPELDKITEKYKKNLVVISIRNDPKGHWENFVAKKKMKGLQWNELTTVSKLEASYGVDGTPYYVLISPEAKVQKTWFGYSKGSLEKIMKEEIK